MLEYIIGRLIFIMKKIIPDTPIQKWLRKPIHSSKYVYINRWSIVHFSFGFLFGYIFLSLYPVKFPYLLVFGLLVLYEVWEQKLGDAIFYEKETPQDYIWDLIVGMTGFSLYWLATIWLI